MKRRVYIYNISDQTQNITFPKPILRNIDIGPGQFAWIPKPTKEIFAETKNGSVYLPLSADYIFITNTAAGTNLTMKEGVIENSSDITVVVYSNDFSYTLTPHTNIKTFIPRGIIWNVRDPLTRIYYGGIKLKENDETVVFNGKDLYAKSSGN